VHCTGIRIGERKLVLTTFLKRFAMSLKALTPPLDRVDLLLEVFDLTAWPNLVILVGIVELLEIAQIGRASCRERV
jgi:hypothetical protein